MSAATVTSKGQITIPKFIRERLKIQTGDKVHFFIDDSGKVTFLPVRTDVRALKGIVPKPKKPVTVNDMNEAIRVGGGR